MAARAKAKGDKTDGERVYRLKEGLYSGILPGWERPRDKNGKELFNDPENGQVISAPKKIYNANEPGNNVVKSDINLVERFGPDKFELVSGDPDVVDARAAAANETLIKDNASLANDKAALEDRVRELERKLKLSEEQVSDEPGLEGLRKDDLIAPADEEEVEYGTHDTKAELIEKIEAARAARK